LMEFSIGDLVRAKKILDVPFDPIEGLGIIVDIEPWGEYTIYVVYFFDRKALRWFEREDLILVNSTKNVEKE